MSVACSLNFALTAEKVWNIDILIHRVNQNGIEWLQIASLAYYRTTDQSHVINFTFYNLNLTLHEQVECLDEI